MLWPNIESEIIPVSEKHGIGQVVWSPLGQGVLTGKYKKGAEPPEGSRAAENSKMVSRLLTDTNLEKVAQLTQVAQELGISMAQLALAWVLRQPNVSSALVGASRPDQIEENAKASGVKLSADVVEKIEKILG